MDGLMDKIKDNTGQIVNFYRFSTDNITEFLSFVN